MRDWTCALKSIIVFLVKLIFSICFTLKWLIYPFCSLLQNTIAEIEKAYNATYKPKLAAEIDSKCSNELKKVLLPKLKGIKQVKF